MKKLTTNEILTHLQNGATLSKVYCVYSHWVLTLPSGHIIYNMRKGAPDSAMNMAKRSNGYEFFNNSKMGFSIRINNQKQKPKLINMNKLPKVRTLEQALKDPRVEDAFIEKDDFGTTCWINLKEGYISESMGCGTIHEDTVKECLHLLNTDVIKEK